MVRLTFPELNPTVTAGSTGTPALEAWRQGVANALYGGVNVVAIGSSTTQGLNSTILSRRYVDQLGALLHSRYNLSTVPGGRHILGIDTGGSVWTFTGTHSTNTDGLALSSVTLATSATMGRTETCTGYDVHYAQGPGAGAFTVSVAGGGAVTVTPDTNGTAGRHDGVYTSPTIGSASNSLLITATAATVISGVYARGGDETTGVRVYNSGLSGTDSSSFSGGAQSLYQRLASLSPRLVLIMLGANDYSGAVNPTTFTTNMQTIINRIVGAVTPTPSILLVGTYARLDVFSPTYPWSSYLTAMSALATANPTVCDYIDISGPYPTSQAADQASLVIDTADYVHQTDKGHRMMAGAISDVLYAPAPTAYTQPVFDPRQISNLLAWYSADNIAQSDNTAVASWAPTAGVETAALAQATGGNQPIFRTGQVNSRPAVLFTAASSQNMKTATWAGKRSTPITVVSAFKLNTGQTGNVYSGGISGTYVYAGNNSGSTLAIGAGNTAEITTTTTQGVWHILVAVYNGATPNSAIYHDNHVATQTGTTTTGTNAALSAFLLGSNSGATSQFLDGAIGDVAIFGKACPVVEITALANWFGARYGVTIA